MSFLKARNQHAGLLKDLRADSAPARSRTWIYRLGGGRLIHWTTRACAVQRAPRRRHDRLATLNAWPRVTLLEAKAGGGQASIAEHDCKALPKTLNKESIAGVGLIGF
jgi:hypothetical protein